MMNYDTGYCKACEAEMEVKRVSNSISENSKNAERDIIRAKEEHALGDQLYRSSSANGKSEALVHYLRAAELGLDVAQAQVGWMYMTGDGVEKNVSLGMEWTKKSAGQGYALAESNLAGYFLNGIGVPADSNEAIRLYQSAAEHGDDYSAYALGLIYENGELIGKDYKKAYEYYLLGAERGNTASLGKILTDQEYVNLKGCEQCQLTLKREFNAMLGYIKKAKIPVADKYLSNEVIKQVVDIKRCGYYVRANRMYMLLTGNLGALSCHVAVPWLKVLGAAGDVKDAIMLGEYVRDNSINKVIEQSWELLNHNLSKIYEYIENEKWGELAQRLTDMSGGYGADVSINDIDIYREKYGNSERKASMFGVKSGI